MLIAHPKSPVGKLVQKALPVADPETNWDGNGARDRVLQWAGGDLSKPEVQAKYRKAFLAVDGDPSLKGSYKLPFADVIGGKLTVVPKGLAAAKAALNGARTGVELPEDERSAAESKVKKDEPADPAPETAPDLEYAVTKASEEERYTFGPLYLPDHADAHNEATTATELQKAMWNFARAGNRTIRKQHQDGTAIGEVVEHVVWPYEAQVDLALPGRDVRKATLPAGTAYVGVIWTPEAWPAVKGGAITGYSLGGRAMRVRSGELLPPMAR